MCIIKMAVLFSLFAAAVIFTPYDAQAMSDQVCKNNGGVVKWNGTHLKLCCEKNGQVLYCEGSGGTRSLGKRKKRTY